MEEGSLARPDQDVLRHHVVGQEDVGRVVENAITILVTVLAGIAAKAHGRIREIPILEFPQRFQLAVDEGVHRVDQQRPYGMSLGVVSYDGVVDGNKVGETLA